MFAATLGPDRRLPLLLTSTSVAIALAALVVGGVQARTSTTRSAADNGPGMQVSPNWSGYVASGTSANPVSYSTVTGTWTVPTATCDGNAAGGFSSIWVGLGGYTTKRQEEVGTDTNCDAHDKPIYYAWFELVPYIAYNVPPSDKVRPGDTITGLVKILSPVLVELNIQNQTRGWTFDRKIAFSTQDTSTAEWIVESPVSCLRFVCHEANLTNFGNVTIQNIGAVGNGSSGTLNDSDWNVTELQLVPGQVTVPTLDPEGSTPTQGTAASPAGATPGDASSDGKSFNVTWAKSPGGV